MADLSKGWSKQGGQVKVVKPPLPSPDKRWKIIDAKMRKMGYQPHALIETLHAVQESFGYLDEVALRWVAKSLRVPPSKVYGVSTFYNFFTLKPQGAHTCVVCLGTACYVKSASKILEAIEVFTKIKPGETTPDRQLSLLTVRCIGACGIAPAVVYDGNVSGRVTPEQATEKLKGYFSHAS
ncbi:MAG: bidirectional hydrogenase complex protein HoxE [Methylacidiphilales bacterium]|nr:bidirectional hydrogenase complex protein HoxE [Candidatus Methylacidiphilales bacterium]